MQNLDVLQINSYLSISLSIDKQKDMLTSRQTGRQRIGVLVNFKKLQKTRSTTAKDPWHLKSQRIRYQCN